MEVIIIDEQAEVMMGIQRMMRLETMMMMIACTMEMMMVMAVTLMMPIININISNNITGR